MFFVPLLASFAGWLYFGHCVLLKAVSCVSDVRSFLFRRVQVRVS